MLEPGQESRSLVNCAVTWPRHGSVRVRAAALVSPMPRTVKVEDIMAGAEEDSLPTALRKPSAAPRSS